MNKHAYLIIANRNFEQLKKLIELLDDTRNDIYLLIDATSSEQRIRFSCNLSNLHILPEMPIYWGDCSQIQAELMLFSAAAPEHYNYYHLLSGLDLPLVSQDTIHNFFDSHQHRQFVTFSSQVSKKSLTMRLRKHIFTHYFRPNGINKVPRLLLSGLRKIEGQYLKLTTRPNANITFGSNWVSIDDDFIQKIVEPQNLRFLTGKFKGGFLVDELLIPFELQALGFTDTVYHHKPVHDRPGEFQGNLRYINWWSGSPRTWRMKDLSELEYARQQGHFFSRKFDDRVDKEIIEEVIQHSKNS